MNNFKTTTGKRATRAESKCGKCSQLSPFHFLTIHEICWCAHSCRLFSEQAMRFSHCSLRCCWLLPRVVWVSVPGLCCMNVSLRLQICHHFAPTNRMCVSSTESLKLFANVRFKSNVSQTLCQVKSPVELFIQGRNHLDSNSSVFSSLVCRELFISVAPLKGNAERPLCHHLPALIFSCFVPADLRRVAAAQDGPGREAGGEDKPDGGND